MQWRLSKHKGFQWKLPDRSLLRSKLIYLAKEFPWPYFRGIFNNQPIDWPIHSIGWLFTQHQSFIQSVRQSVIRSFVCSVRHSIHAASLSPGSLGNLLREFVRKPTNTWSFTHSFIELYNLFIYLFGHLYNGYSSCSFITRILGNSLR